MKLASGLLMVALLSGAAFAQTITRNFGSVIFPGGTSATNPNITRNFGSVVFPGGSPSTPAVRTSPATIPAPVFYGRPSGGFNGGNSFNRGNGPIGGNSFSRGSAHGNRGGAGLVYSYPVYVPAYLDPSASPDAYMPQGPGQQPNVTVIYPQQQDARPIVIQMPQPAAASPAPSAYEPAELPAPPENEAPHYLIAFKDHSIYYSVAYWFDGDTLHYFTKGDTHNQAPVALIDRELTERLNREMGLDFKLPPAR